MTRLAHVAGHVLGWALTLLIAAIVAAILGVSGVAAVSVDIARSLVVICLVPFVGALVMRAMRQ